MGKKANETQGSLGPRASRLPALAVFRTLGTRPSKTPQRRRRRPWMREQPPSPPVPGPLAVSLGPGQGGTSGPAT